MCINFTVPLTGYVPFSVERGFTGKGDRMRIEGLEERASEKELVAWLSSNEDLKNQKLAELLHRRNEELDRRLAVLNSDRKLLQRLRR